MSRHPTPAKAATIEDGSPAQAAPGDALLWVRDPPDGPAHHAVEVGLVRHEPGRDRVRVVSRDGAEREFDAGRVVVLVRGLQELLGRSRASDGPRSRPVGAG